MEQELSSSRYDQLFSAFLQLRTKQEAKKFLRDLCTMQELQDLASRWEVVRLLHQGKNPQDIRQRTGASLTTIARIAWWLRSGTGGYRAVLRAKQ